MGPLRRLTTNRGVRPAAGRCGRHRAMGRPSHVQAMNPSCVFLSRSRRTPRPRTRRSYCQGRCSGPPACPPPTWAAQGVGEPPKGMEQRWGSAETPKGSRPTGCRSRPLGCRGRPWGRRNDLTSGRRSRLGGRSRPNGPEPPKSSAEPTRGGSPKRSAEPPNARPAPAHAAPGASWRRGWSQARGAGWDEPPATLLGAPICPAPPCWGHAEVAERRAPTRPPDFGPVFPKALDRRSLELPYSCPPTPSAGGSACLKGAHLEISKLNESGRCNNTGDQGQPNARMTETCGATSPSTPRHRRWPSSMQHQP